MQDESRKRRVLIVDDEQIIADTLAMILIQTGFEATAVYSGARAVEAARELKPDILISDVIMAERNGIEAALEIAQTLPGCRVILLSGQAATAHLLERTEREGHHFEVIAKPVHPQVLLDLLKSTP
jgi:DNA-binding NtrC family response regulator